jgi:hypothetical protein
MTRTGDDSEAARRDVDGDREKAKALREAGVVGRVQIGDVSFEVGQLEHPAALACRAARSRGRAAPTCFEDPDTFGGYVPTRRRAEPSRTPRRRGLADEPDNERHVVERARGRRAQADDPVRQRAEEELGDVFERLFRLEYLYDPNNPTPIARQQDRVTENAIASNIDTVDRRDRDGRHPRRAT